MAHIYSIILALAFIFIGCNSTLETQDETQSVETISHLPTCELVLQSQLVVVKEPPSLYYCDGEEWTVIQGGSGNVGGGSPQPSNIRFLGEFTTPPENPSLNDAYYNTAEGRTLLWNGTVWVTLVRDGQNGQDGQKGDKGDAGDKGESGEDGLSINWIGTQSYHPVNPSTNDAYYNDVDKRAYIWDGTGWNTLIDNHP